ncbi:acyl-CoA desaturase [Planctomicrobium sp.]|jgi:stearoyl-CoA desaturase (Delta-9 desaturase)|nr:acyl-CoA desaturase [Planctomicrobium sp.]MBT5019269.1 acyl-CoA desaturase [Planctomicrobium sp.]MDA7504115.1 acyl-CoA desaturase [bacterium]MDA7528150.1 acyl-CoA desaturase [bacterium]MDB4733531.1 acyl-CoA desaturase [Planctomicrobium sp.]
MSNNLGVVSQTVTDEVVESPAPVGLSHIDWGTAIPYLLLHLLCFSVFWVRVSPIAVGLFIFMLYLRVFALTAFYHRYFSHKAFQTSRVVQFLGGFLGCTAAQRGPVWWAAHHRHHHRRSDEPTDVHSPRQHGFWWSHMLWFLTHENAVTDERVVKDWMKFPELRWLEKLHILPAILLAVVMFLLGDILQSRYPSLNTGPWQILVWGFLMSTIALYHITYFVNSLAHVIGSQRFETGDDSRNNFFIAMLTWGEGWHNNHHYYQGSARQGFYWWEIDMTYNVLKVMSWFGLVWNLKPVPQKILDEGRERSASQKKK